MKPKPSSSAKPQNFMSPRSYQKKPVVLDRNNASECNIVVNCYKYIQNNWSVHEPSNKTTLCEKTATMLGVCIADVHHIVAEYEKMEESKSKFIESKPKFTSKINDYHKRGIIKKVHSFYARGELATFENILRAVNEDDDLPNFDKRSFEKVLKRLKFEYVKRYALIEKSDITLKRIYYLGDIQKYRTEKRPIYYVMDETWEYAVAGQTGIETTGNTKKILKRAQNTAKGRKLTVVHVGNENGFVEGALDFFESNENDDSVDANRFEQWFENLLPKLGENAVVVVDNAPNQSRLQELLPSWQWDKAKLKAWLKTKEISFDEDNIYPELYLKARKEKARFKKYVIDEIAKKYNVDILRLPPYHYDLSPMELVWAEVKAHLSETKTPLEFENIRENIQGWIQNVSSDKLRHYWERIKEKEDNHYNKLDHLIDDTVDRFLEDNSLDSDPEEDYDKLSSESDDTCSDTDDTSDEDESNSDEEEVNSDSYESCSDTSDE